MGSADYEALYCPVGTTLTENNELCNSWLKKIIQNLIFLTHNSKKNCIFAFCGKKPVQVAQPVEHIPFKDGVLGSNPSLNTTFSL